MTDDSVQCKNAIKHISTSMVFDFHSIVQICFHTHIPTLFSILYYILKGIKYNNCCRELVNQIVNHRGRENAPQHPESQGGGGGGGGMPPMPRGGGGGSISVCTAHMLTAVL